MSENYNLQPDTSSQTVRNGDSYNLDTRERLEADIYRAADELEKFSNGERFLNTHKIIRWLNRQAEITHRECERPNWDYCETCDALAELTAERDELRDIITHLPKTEAECEACQGAHDRLMFNCKVDMDKLRDELKHKQLVIDRQRDSFAKMEREYRELQDVCGELERTIENLRGD